MSMYFKAGLLASVAVLLLAGCTFFPVRGITGSGNLVTETYDFDNFTAVRAGSAFQVTIAQGDTYSVQVTADDNVMDKLIVESRGGALILEMRQPSVFLGNVTLRAEITMPELEEVRFSGATHGSMTGFTTDGAFLAEASGASTIEGDIESDSLRVDISGASNALLTGATRELEVHASGASKANLSGLTAENARAEASGASRVEVNVSGELRAIASGASTVEYSGNPANVREDESGASTIREIR